MIKPLDGKQSACLFCRVLKSVFSEGIITDAVAGWLVSLSSSSLQIGPLVPCCSRNVFTFRICLAHESSECPAIQWGCQAYWFQIHESGEAVQWAAFGQEEGDLRLVSKSQHLLCTHGDTTFCWPLQRRTSGLQGWAAASKEASWKGETKERRREKSSEKEIVLVRQGRTSLSAAESRRKCIYGPSTSWRSVSFAGWRLFGGTPSSPCWNLTQLNCDWFHCNSAKLSALVL